VYFASRFPSSEVQDETEVGGSTPVAASNWVENVTTVVVLINFAFFRVLFQNRLLGKKKEEIGWGFEPSLGPKRFHVGKRANRSARSSSRARN
jgi:hypothetical protein